MNRQKPAGANHGFTDPACQRDRSAGIEPLRRAAPNLSMRHTLLIAALLPLCSALARQSSAQVAAPERVIDEAAVSAGLESIDVKSISADLHFFASDEMRGRDTPSREQRLAAAFLGARLAGLGFQPGNGDSYIAPYELGWRAIDPNKTQGSAVGSGRASAFSYGVDYVHPTSTESMEQVVSGPVRFGGKGTKDELSGTELKGSWLVVLDDGEWPTDDRRGMSSSRYWRGRRTAAKGAGAVGMLVVPGAGYEGEPIPSAFKRVTDQRLQGSVWLPSGRVPNFGSGDLPVLVLSVEAGQRLAEMGGVDLAAATIGQEFGLDFTEDRVRQGSDPYMVEAENVIGLWPGSDPELANEVIAVSAHYDHVGARGDDIYNGADDNGSGSMGMLAVAEALEAHGPLTRTVAVIWVSGEEKGLLGSKAWCANPTLPEGMRVVANINMDMIGRNAPNQILYTPTPEKPEIYNGLAKLVEAHAPSEGFTELGSADAYYYRSDQQSFQEAFDIPVMFLFADVHEDYHQPSDTPDKIDVDKIVRVSRLIFRVLCDLQDPELDL